MVLNRFLKGVILFSALASESASAKETIYDFTLDDIDGNPVPFRGYRGKVLLIVNVAGKCGYTYQYETLEAIYRRYRDDGLVILGFPSNDFLRQEPGTDEEIKEFCQSTYDVTFPLFSKIAVKGRKIHPLYKYLTSKDTNPDFSGRITWNFNKFLISAKAEFLARFGSRDDPDDPAVVVAIEAALGNRGAS